MCHELFLMTWLPVVPDHATDPLESTWSGSACVPSDPGAFASSRTVPSARIDWTDIVHPLSGNAIAVGARAADAATTIAAMDRARRVTATLHWLDRRDRPSRSSLTVHP